MLTYLIRKYSNSITSDYSSSRMMEMSVLLFLIP